MYIHIYIYIYIYREIEREREREMDRYPYRSTADGLGLFESADGDALLIIPFLM